MMTNELYTSFGRLINVYFYSSVCQTAAFCVQNGTA